MFTKHSEVFGWKLLCKCKIIISSQPPVPWPLAWAFVVPEWELFMGCSAGSLGCIGQYIRICRLFFFPLRKTFQLGGMSCRFSPSECLPTYLCWVLRSPRADCKQTPLEKREGKRSFWRNGPSYKEESSNISLSGKIWTNHSGKSVSLAPRDSVHVYTPKGEKNSRFAFSAQVSLPSFAWTSQEPWKQTYPA